MDKGDGKMSGDKGIVYCLTNPSMDNYVKIGQTTNLTQRLKSLDTTGVPLSFECFYAIEVEDYKEIEKLLHQVFADSRTRESREFFQIGAQRVRAAMQLTGGLDVTPTTDTVENDDDQKALDKARTKREAFNFDMVGIPPQTELYFYDEKEITCTVIDKKQISFKGETTSLSKAASHIFIERKSKKGEPISNISNMSYNGTVFWYLDGESLNERRQRMESDVS